MKTLQYKCRLLSDIILNMKSATEGNNETLDFIPGNNFLGIVAKERYGKIKGDNDLKIALEIFHSGKVRFGDAHPCAKESNVRSLRTPAEFFYPKLANETDGRNYVLFHLDSEQLKDKEIRKLQLKQCRKGFYAFSGNKGKPAESSKSFSIKSAYDREARTSAKEQMYGYESLAKGLELLFEVEVDNESLAEEIDRALIGIKHIGRSRTAQFGLVEISECSFENSPSSEPQDNLNAVYADGRLIFLDQNGEPTFQPTAEQLGFGKDDEIIWSKSQIRTFQYSPWNGKRHTYDTDRCGIEKGSVIIVRSSSGKVGSTYIGSYNNEGFGKVIYNPYFLDTVSGGLSAITLESNTSTKDVNTSSIQDADSPLLRYISRQLEYRNANDQTYKVVNKFVREHGDAFIPTDFDRDWGFIEKFSSQWGTIRSMAASCENAEDLYEKIFNNNDGYIYHGVAAEKWENRKRGQLLKQFFEDLGRKTDDHEAFDDASKVNAVINLASEMAKYCKNKEEKI